jgi:hypothetical protein
MLEQHERLRRRYLPETVRLLLIGESAPASGRFFYRRDSGLYRAIRAAFQVADDRITDENFLDRFRACGCYLVDLCREPVDDLEPARRREARRRGEVELTAKIRKYRPPVIMVLLRSIRPNVLRASGQAGWSGRLLNTPYPARWVRHREQFLETAVPEIRALCRVQ